MNAEEAALSGALHVFVTRRAWKDARALGLEGDVAEMVRGAISDGSVARDRDRDPDRDGPRPLVVAGDGWLARVERLPFGWRPGRYLSVRAVEAHAGGPIRHRRLSRTSAAERGWALPDAEEAAASEAELAAFLEELLSAA